MTVPRNRLLWLVALWVTPALTLLSLGGATAVYGFVLAASALAIVLLDWALSRESLDTLSVKADSPLHAITGRAFELALTVVSAEPVAALRLEFDIPTGFEETTGLAPKQDADCVRGNSAAQRFVAQYVVGARGRYSLRQLHVETTSRFGLLAIRRAIALEVWVHVYPDLQRDRRQLAAHNWGKQLGAMAMFHAGRGRSFDRLRDYVPGDEPEDIHWRATAKRRRPITKLYELEKDQRIYVAIDQSRLSCRPSPRDEHDEKSPESLLERYISSALLLGSVAQSQGDQFGLLGFGDKVTRFSPAGAGPLHYRACREATLQLRTERVNPDYRELFGFFASHERRRSLLIVLTSVDDPALCEELIQSAKLVADRHLVVAAAVRPPHAHSLLNPEPVSGPEDILERLAEHLEYKRLHQTARKLGKLGVRYLSLEHHSMVPLLVGSYAQIKRGQLL